jgi:hypothetical protein
MRGSSALSTSNMSGYYCSESPSKSSIAKVPTISIFSIFSGDGLSSGLGSFPKSSISLGGVLFGYSCFTNSSSGIEIAKARGSY